MYGFCPNESSEIGMLLLAGCPLRSVYANPEAVRILSYPEKRSGDLPLDYLLAGRIRQILNLQWTPQSRYSAAELVSGRRHYLCRLVSLQPQVQEGQLQPSGSIEPAVAMILERGNSAFDSLNAEQFRLTARERQTLHFLVLGLTNKDIAQRMNISPHTVKAFLRAIMIKTGSSTRSGIVGKCAMPRLNTHDLSYNVADTYEVVRLG